MAGVSVANTDLEASFCSNIYSHVSSTIRNIDHEQLYHNNIIEENILTPI